ncbi:MAG: LysM peptidoglycan-binding domain-containing protein [Bdellovibrionales bacterium]|nr:LysM peptidoglycan-binding domain-containing protein [Bdellovibrionales bacterium]
MIIASTRLASRVLTAVALCSLFGCASFNRSDVESSTAASPAPAVLDAAGVPSETAIFVPSSQVEKDLMEAATTDVGTRSKAEIPKEVNDLVVKWVNYFTGPGRVHMTKYLGRSSKYVPLMKDILRKNGLPEDLIYLALIESGFSSGARSHAGAVGFWQFIRGTGRRYGLKISPYVDERKDFVAATEAASQYLKGLYNIFGSWYLAIASYNVGENRVMRVVMNQQTRDFWTIARSRKLPRETIDYVPKFIAAKMIAQHPSRYGFSDVEYQDALAYDEIQVSHQISLRTLAEKSGVDVESIRSLNPMYRTDWVPVESGAQVTIRVPLGQKEKVSAQLEAAKVTNSMQVVSETPVDYHRHKVRSGDTLGGIARKYGVSIAQIRDANELGRKAMLRVGSFLQVPMREGRKPGSFKKDRSVSDRSSLVPPVKNAASVTKNNKLQKFYTVRKGDTLLEIARRHQTSVGSIVQKNRLQKQTRLLAGRRLEIPR